MHLRVFLQKRLQLSLELVNLGHVLVLDLEVFDLLLDIGRLVLQFVALLHGVNQDVEIAFQRDNLLVDGLGNLVLLGVFEHDVL